MKYQLIVFVLIVVFLCLFTVTLLTVLEISLGLSKSILNIMSMGCGSVSFFIAWYASDKICGKHYDD